MKKLFLISLLATVTVACAVGCSQKYEESRLILKYDYSLGSSGWQHGFAEYSPSMDIESDAGIKPLPVELGIDGTGYFLQSMNLSDDVFMFIKKRIGPEEGIQSDTAYHVLYKIKFASNAPSGAVGIGGAPGESVFVKAGAAPQEPEVVLETVANHEYYMMTVDKGEGNSGGGLAATQAGNIANGIPAEEFDFTNPVYAIVEIEHEHEYPVTADENGHLWLLAGTDSGFEGLTSIYFISMEIVLEQAS